MGVLYEDACRTIGDGVAGDLRQTGIYIEIDTMGNAGVNAIGAGRRGFPVQYDIAGDGAGIPSCRGVDIARPGVDAAAVVFDISEIIDEIVTDNIVCPYEFDAGITRGIDLVILNGVVITTERDADREKRRRSGKET